LRLLNVPARSAAVTVHEEDPCSKLRIPQPPSWCLRTSLRHLYSCTEALKRSGPNSNGPLTVHADLVHVDLCLLKGNRLCFGCFTLSPLPPTLLSLHLDMGAFDFLHTDANLDGWHGPVTSTIGECGMFGVDYSGRQPSSQSVDCCASQTGHRVPESGAGLAMQSLLNAQPGPPAHTPSTPRHR
jgi:hypothetical protein